MFISTLVAYLSLRFLTWDHLSWLEAPKGVLLFTLLGKGEGREGKGNIQQKTTSHTNKTAPRQTDMGALIQDRGNKSNTLPTAGIENRRQRYNSIASNNSNNSSSFEAKHKSYKSYKSWSNRSNKLKCHGYTNVAA